MEQEKEKAQEQQALAAERDKKITDAQARVKELERQVLEYKNPLFPARGCRRTRRKPRRE